jgi:hypothetical protein
MPGRRVHWYRKRRCFTKQRPGRSGSGYQGRILRSKPFPINLFPPYCNPGELTREEEAEPGKDWEKLYSITPDGELALFVYSDRMKKRVVTDSPALT